MVARVAERAATDPPDAAPSADASAGLCADLFTIARAHPQRTALRDAGDRAAWCGRPAIVWTYAAASEIVGRLACGIGAWRLPAGSRIGLWFSGGAEAALAHLAVEAAGHLPCPMPAAWDGGALSAAIEAAGLAAILTEGRRGGRRPAEELAQAALRHFGLRYLAAFGPGVPDGVISLDAMALERALAVPAPSRGLVTFAGADPARPVYRTAAALAAAIAAHRAAHRPALPAAAPERILTLLPPHDLRGLVTGLGAALADGAALESLIPFEAAAFRAALTRAVPTRLVVPAALEPALAQTPVPWTVRAVDLVHRAPARLRAGSARGPQALRLDVLALGEDAVVTRPRGDTDLAALLAGTLPLSGTPALSRGADGRLACRGLACAAAPLGRDARALPDPEAWRPTGYGTVVSAGAVAVVPAA